MGVIPNPKMAFIFPISCIFALIFPILLKYFPKCEGKGSFLKSQIKSLAWTDGGSVIACWHRTLFTTKQLYITIELYEMWCSEINDRDLTSVGRIHDAMIQRGGDGGQGLQSPLAPPPPPPRKIIRNIGFPKSSLIQVHNVCLYGEISH